MWIRTETQDDHPAIRALLGEAFADADGNGSIEQRIVEALRDDGELSLCLVADIDGRIAGVAVFSPVAIQGAKSWYGLGPVAVAPRDQGHGVGTALIRAGLAEIADQGAAAASCWANRTTTSASASATTASCATPTPRRSTSSRWPLPMTARRATVATTRRFPRTEAAHGRTEPARMNAADRPARTRWTP